MSEGQTTREAYLRLSQIGDIGIGVETDKECRILMYVHVNGISTLYLYGIVDLRNMQNTKKQSNKDFYIYISHGSI